ncbi:MAG: AAA domain-containing protein, partial [Gemmatimonadales bacterium]
LIPNEYISADAIKDAVARYAAAWERGVVASRAVDDLLSRRPPRIAGHTGGPLVPDGSDLRARVCELVGRLDGTTLCIQGPPGTGKTSTAAAVIADLLRKGKRVGVTATSHKVILNLLAAVVRERGAAGGPAPIYKVGKEEDDPLVQAGAVTLIESRDVEGIVGAGPVLVGGTAWVFSREELEGRLDYLFIDEAGQVCLANAVAMGLSATNLVLVGDQMQLGQPVQGSHPGETGLSCLEYLLQGNATVPPETGVFLGISYRMHGDVCRFISEAIYEGRLTSGLKAQRHRVVRGARSSLVPAETGVVWVPVPHDGCAQSSDEEVDVISRIVDELLARTVIDQEGRSRTMTLQDILLVAPFNAQVRSLRRVLGSAARVGSVDLFQGQEAAVVI